MIRQITMVPADNTRFVLQPNDGSSLKGDLAFWFSLFALSTIFGLAFVAAGVWLVIPFLCFELLALACAYRVVSRRISQQEVISFDEGRVTVEKGRERAEESWSFQRNSARIVVEPSAEPLGTYRICLSGDKGVVVLGEFLPEADVNELIALLAACNVRIYRRECDVVCEI